MCLSYIEEVIVFNRH